MTVIERSALLQKELPDSYAQALSGLGVESGAIWLCTDTDLNLSGGYDQVYLVATEHELLSVAASAAPLDGGIRKHIARGAIQEIRARQGVGGGFLQVRVEGIWADMLAFSNARADTFHKAIVKLQAWQSGATPEVNSADDVDPRRCRTCGMALQFKGDICRRCVNRGAVFIRTLKLMRPYAGTAAVMLGLVLANVGLGLIPQNLVRILVDNVLAPEQAHKAMLEPATARIYLLGLVAALAGSYLTAMCVYMATHRLSSYVGTQVTYDMRQRVFNQLSQLSVDYYDRYNVGQLITRVSGDTEQMKGFVNQMTSGFLQQIVQIVAVGAMLFWMNWKLALLTLLPSPLVVLGAILFWKRIYPRYYRVWDSNSKLAGTLNTILSGIRVVKAFAQEDREQKRFARSSLYVRDSFRRVEYLVGIFNPGIGMVFQLGGLIVWFVGGQWVLQDKAAAAATGAEPALTLGTLLAFIGFLWMFYQPLGNLTQLTNWLTGFLTAASRTFEILDTPIQIAEAQTPVPMPTIRGEIEFQNVSFGYDRHHPILKGVSCSIKAGERIGIVGKSGSGKTTLINLLGRFYDVDQGRILLDGLDIRDIKKEDMRRHVGVVLQEPFLFRGTIYQNLTYGAREATPEQVVAAAKAANCHDFIMRHPLGYDTYVGERGSGLSGGERQRISIARALLYDPRVLILDEATSSVDTESEKLIQDALKRITEGRTTIAIAHRLSTLKNSDRIFVVDVGRIVEQGTHHELLAINGIYHNLVKIQTELSSEKNIDQLVVQKALEAEKK